MGHELVTLGSNESATLATRNLFASGHPYHQRAKRIEDPAILEKVIKNNPLKDLKVPIMSGPVQADEIVNLAEDFLGQKFFNLTDLGFTVGIKEKVDAAAEKTLYDGLMAKYDGPMLAGSKDSLHDEYESMCAVRNIFEFARAAAEENKLDQQHLMLLSTVNDVMQTLTMHERPAVLKNLSDLCTWNGLRGRFRTPAALHIKHLPDLFTACPVWFVKGKGVADNTRENDPHVDDATKFFCDLVGTKNFAWFYQMYNRRTRTFDKFKGPDLLPAHIAVAIPEFSEKFDYLVIATPYHDVASKEWADPAWRSSIDPYLIGFKKGFDYMIIIERWSGTGLFPLMTDMIADTVTHVKTHLDKLSRFSNGTYWYKGNNTGYLGGTKGVVTVTKTF